MSGVSFEKVPGKFFSKALKDDKELLPAQSDDNSDSETVSLHIYIVFSEEISIEDGIKTIESTVLSGDALEVSRSDEAGHAIVAIVSPSRKKQIEDLSIVKKIREILPDHPNNDKTAPTNDALL